MLIGIFECGVAHASTSSQIVLFEYEGKSYYIENLEQFLEKYADDICISNNDINMQDLLKTLLSVCRQSINTMDRTYLGRKIDWIRRQLGNHLMSTKSALEYCLVRKEDLVMRQNKPKYDYSYSINNAVQLCVNSVLPWTDSKTCPISNGNNYIYVQNDNYMDNLKNLNDYVGHTFHFSEIISPSPLIAVFNGYMFVVCDGTNVKYTVMPAFSGYNSCQGTRYESWPNTGSTPDGVYMVRHKDIETMPSTQQSSWGQYRMPLIPAQETNTYGRSSMYLHGTTIETKRRSGGCVSLGTGIPEFIESFFKYQNRDMLIIVNKASTVQVWQI